MPIYARHVSLLLTVLLVAAYAYAYFFVNLGDHSKNEGTVASMINPLLAAMVVVTTYLYGRTDKSCDLLIAIERLYQECKDGCEILESDELYNKVCVHLVRWNEGFLKNLERDDSFRVVFDPNSSLDDTQNINEAAKEWPAGLREIDRLIRFYLLLRSFIDTGQIGTRVLRKPYRYMLSHYFNPNRKAFMVYVHLHYPHIREWLSEATDPNKCVAQRATSSNYFFQPQNFNWEVVKMKGADKDNLGSRVAPLWLAEGVSLNRGNDSWKRDCKHSGTSGAPSS